MLSLQGVHASKREWEEGRECVVLFFILSPLKRRGGGDEGSSQNPFNHPCKLPTVVQTIKTCNESTLTVANTECIPLWESWSLDLGLGSARDWLYNMSF